MAIKSWGQQLSLLSRADEGIFRVPRENSSHILFAHISGRNNDRHRVRALYPFAHTVSIP